MKNHVLWGLRWGTLAIVCFFFSLVHAQVEERAFCSDYNINPEKAGSLFLELDNITFFKDNEFNGTIMKGYTLPGLWLQPKGVYYPLKNLKIELGAHALIYSGAYKYPNYAYQDIEQWKGEQFQRGTHILPFFRAQVAFSRVNLVLGNIYGGQNHDLILPLYNPELNLTCDPESGFQFLYDSKHLHVDTWVNWQSFIFDIDNHQESFIFGMSSQVRVNKPDAHFHYYFPIQIIAQHRGGEQNTAAENRVQTFANAAIGAGIVWNVNRRLLKRVNLELDALGYYQQAGTLWPFGTGTGLFANASADLGRVRVRGGYFICKDFISILGSPYFGAVSTQTVGATYTDPQTYYASIEYSRALGKHYAFGAKAELYYSVPGTMTHPDGSRLNPGNSNSCSFGVFLRVNPSFLIKKFK